VKTDKPFQRSRALAQQAARERKAKLVADLMAAAQMAARRLHGQHATWVNVGTKADRSGVIITTVVGGEERAYAVMNKQQLGELIRNLQSHLDELK